MKELTLRELNRLEDKPMFSVRDPISALTHFIGFIAAIAVTPLLMSRVAVTDGNEADLIGAAIYMLSMVLLYGASTSHHSFVLPSRPDRILKKLDHMSIFVLIAGTYTPICLSALPEKTGIPLLIIIWSVAAAGILLKAFCVYCPKYVSSMIYIAMGWLAILKIGTIYTSLGQAGFFWLLLGGVFYTIGGILYALKISFSRDWGNHEVFHLFVLMGSLCHFIMIFFFVL